MGWVLTADDRLIDVAASGSTLGAEVSHGGGVAGILVGKGAGPSPTPAQDMEGFVPNKPELLELTRNAKRVGSRLKRHANFDRHFKAHKKLLETALGTSYPKDRAGEDAFLQDLGNLISTGKLSPIGIVTLGKNQRMAFAFDGRIKSSALTAVVYPSGEWNTLLSSNQGKASGFFYQMKFDAKFPFPFMAPSSSGGHARRFL